VHALRPLISQYSTVEAEVRAGQIPKPAKPVLRTAPALGWNRPAVECRDKSRIADPRLCMQTGSPSAFHQVRQACGRTLPRNGPDPMAANRKNRHGVWAVAQAQGLPLLAYERKQQQLQQRQCELQALPASSNKANPTRPALELEFLLELTAARAKARRLSCPCWRVKT